MKILTSIYEKHDFPCNITLGVFDGVHLGHQYILQKLKEKPGNSVVITFKNHPLEILCPLKKPSLIYSCEEKIALLKSFDIDIVILLEFTKDFSDLNYLDFFKTLKANFSFTNFIVGEDIKIGKDQMGDKKSIGKLEKIYGFKTEFLKKIKYEEKIISSSWIRKLINEEKYSLVEKLLNRKYENKEVINV
ncbi:MAG: FAD synthetase family protein [Parachlamydiales bacterium]|jgi:riboflavin kinase/FMN adenylyltransferase